MLQNRYYKNMFFNIKNRLDIMPNKRLLFLHALVLIIVIFIILVLISGVRGNNSDQVPIPTPTLLPGGTSTQQKINPVQKTIIENTTQREVQTLPGLENKITLSNGEIMYTFKSPLISRKNEVLVKDNMAVFERVLVPESSKNPGHLLISDYEKTYGQPQQIIRGSHFYGNLMRTYIYADKGFAFIANPFTGDVFEVHIFVPTSVDSYIQTYGEDVNKNAPDGES